MTNSQPKRTVFQYLVLGGGLLNLGLAVASGVMTLYLRSHHAIMANPISGQTVYLSGLYHHGILAYVTPFEAELSHGLMYGFLGCSIAYLALLCSYGVAKRLRAQKS